MAVVTPFKGSFSSTDPKRDYLFAADSDQVPPPFIRPVSIYLVKDQAVELRNFLTDALFNFKKGQGHIDLILNTHRSIYGPLVSSRTTRPKINRARFGAVKRMRVSANF